MNSGALESITATGPRALSSRSHEVCVSRKNLRARRVFVMKPPAPAHYRKERAEHLSGRPVARQDHGDVVVSVLGHRRLHERIGRSLEIWFGLKDGVHLVVGYAVVQPVGAQQQE